MGGTDWKIVGIFDGGRTGFDSEIWGDVEVIMPAWRRPVFSSVTVRLRDPNSFEAFRQRLENDRRMVVDVKREKQYYDEQSKFMSIFINVLGTVVTFIFSFGAMTGAFEAFKARIAADQRLILEVKQEPAYYQDQSKSLSTFISYLGIALSVIFSIGAMIGAMITMYAAVSNRTQEIGTMRALGFRRRSVLGAFLIESVFLGVLGGIIGLALSTLLQFLTISTTNWNTFSELAFSFTLSPAIVGKALIFSLLMGLVGGFLPAVRASRMKIVEALRTA